MTTERHVEGILTEVDGSGITLKTHDGLERIAITDMNAYAAFASGLFDGQRIRYAYNGAHHIEALTGPTPLDVRYKTE